MWSRCPRVFNGCWINGKPRTNRARKSPRQDTARCEHTMKLWDHLWAGVVVSLAIGVFLIGTSGYYWASNSKRQREIDRHTKEMLTGVEPPAPDPEQVARNWNRDLLVGATVGG